MSESLPQLLQYAGTAISAGSALFGAKSTADAANVNAGIADENAQIAQDQGEAAVVTQRRKMELVLGGQRAAYGASGVRQDTGSAIDVLMATAAAGKLEEQNIKYNANLRSLGFSQTAVLDRRRASTAMTGGLWSAAGQAILGGAKGYAMGVPGAGTKIPDYFGTTERNF